MGPALTNHGITMTMNRFMVGGALAAVLLLVGLPTAANAQGGGFNPAQMRERAVAGVDETVKGLALEGEKAQKVKDILLAAVDKRFEMMAQMRGQGGPPGQGQRGAGMREAMARLNAETESSLSELLTPAELEKYREIQAQQRPGGGRRPPPGS